jgi:hypothetical protein
MGLLVASRPARLWLALTENHAGQRLSVSPLHVPDHIAVALAGAAPTASAIAQLLCRKSIGLALRRPVEEGDKLINDDEALGLDA